MAKPSVSLPSFSHFAKVSSPFLQCAVCSYIESSKKSEEQEEEAPPQEVDIGPPFFFCFSYFTFLPWFLPPFWILSDFAGVDTGVRDPEFVVPEVVVGSAQVAEQAKTPQSIQKVDSSLISTSGDATMGKTPKVAISDPDSGLPAFLAWFDLLEFNNLPTSHFHCFGPS